jgi:hypothetical protein
MLPAVISCSAYEKDKIERESATTRIEDFWYGCVQALLFKRGLESVRA